MAIKNNAPQKRRVKRVTKKDKERRSILIGAGLICLLVILVVVSVITLNGTRKDKLEVANVPKKSVIEKKVIKKEEKKEVVVAESETNIASLIRLILQDFEIDKSAIVEKTIYRANSNPLISFDVKVDADVATKARKAIQSALIEKGYKVEVSQIDVVAKNEKYNIEVLFEASMQKAPDKKGEVKVTKPATSPVKNRPTPPAKSDIVVKMAILLDDGGANIKLAERFVKMKYPIALAVLPHLQYSVETARLVAAYRKSLFLHFPMQPKSYPDVDPGKGAILTSMPELIIEAVAKENFESLGIKVDGVNNHMGSEFTEDAVKMKQLLQIAGRYTDIFIDSRTTAKTVAYSECQKTNMRCGTNKRFIDNDNDVNLIIEKLYESAELAKKYGEIIIIGHLRVNTLEALEIALPILESRNIAIVPINMVVK